MPRIVRPWHVSKSQKLEKLDPAVFGKSHDYIAPAWPLHSGEPAELRANPPSMLGKLRLKEVIAAIEMAAGDDMPILAAHSV